MSVATSVLSGSSTASTSRNAEPKASNSEATAATLGPWSRLWGTARPADRPGCPEDWARGRSDAGALAVRDHHRLPLPDGAAHDWTVHCCRRHGDRVGGHRQAALPGSELV